MKTIKDNSPQLQFHKRKALLPVMAGLMILAGLIAASDQAFAGNNLLVNGDFNLPASTATATGWTPWKYSNSAGNSWANHQNIVYMYNGANNVLDGSYYIAVGSDENGTSGAGMYQIVTGVPGFTYNLSVESAVQNWWWPEGEMRIFFLDATTNILSQSVSNVTTAITGYDIGLPWTLYTMSATAPAGTKQVKVEFASQSGTGTVFFDDASLTSTYDSPTISNVYPNGYTLMQYTNKMTFTAASDTTGINPSGIQLVLNGSNVSSGLVITGGPFTYNASYSGLTSNQLSTAVITVTDTNGIQTTASYSFDTFNPVLLWEAEDFDYTNGLFINNPTLTSTNAPNSYFGVLGVPQVDELDLDGNPPGTGAGPELFRPGDPISTDIVSDTPRLNYVNAELVDTNIHDYLVGYFDGSDWVNYTRNFPTGKYYVYGRLATGSPGAISLGVVTLGRGTSDQTTNILGSFQMANNGWGTYSYVPLTDVYGNLAVLNLSGITALRVNAANAGGNMNFFFIVPANTSLPVITNIYPSGLVLFQPTNQLTFRVFSPIGNNINTNSIHVTLNGINVTNLTETGTSSSWNVGYTGLKSNSSYTAVISVTDVAGNTSSATVTFDTFSGSITWEGEDWDFSNGGHIDNPVLSSTAQANSYFGKVGVQGVDENTLDDSGASLATVGADFLYRASDAMATGLSQDTSRQNYLTAQAGNPSIQDYMLGWFNPGMWVNYTRAFPAGTYNIYVRAAYGGGGSSSAIYLDQVTSGQGTAAQGIGHVGSFTIPATGWTSYSYIPCMDRLGNVAQVTLTGSATTFRLTAGAANVNFFMLVPARTDLPRIANVYPDGSTILQGTNTFAFSVLAATSPSTAINSANITMTLNGSNAPLTFTASGQNWNVTTPLALNVTNYTAVIKATDNASNNVTATVYFDTFSGSSFVWEGEDFNFDNGSGPGQFIDNPIPTSAPAAQSYFGVSGDQGSDYDFGNTIATGSLFLYRPYDYIATDYCPDTPLKKFVTAQLTNPAIRDFYVGWWETNSWINYTRTFPSGNFAVYGRLAGTSGSTYNIQLAQMNGAVSNNLGAFSALGRGYNLYDWVPLQNNGTNVLVSLGGVATLRATTGGNVNVNRYILVTPVVTAAVPFRVSVAIVSGNVQLSYPTQSGHNYQIEYKITLKDASWTPLASYAGDGSVQTHIVGTPTGTTRFYLVVTQ